MTNIYQQKYGFNYKFDQFIKYIKNKTVTFLGLGISHCETIKMLAQKNIHITVRDKKSLNNIDPELIEQLKNFDVKLILGDNYLDNINEDIVFRSPGINFQHPLLSQLHQNGTIITSETEIFFNLCPCLTFGITGSDGKTTTASIINEILKLNGYNVYLGGNIGKALLPLIEIIKPDDLVVAELSSFQLISMRKSPNISVITNIYPNHLDVHKDMHEYINAKKNIFLHQDSLNRTVLNFDNDITRHFINEIRATTSLFSCKNNIIHGAFIDNKKDIYLTDNKSKTFLFNSNDIVIPGDHNIENYLAAIAATQNFVDKSVYKKVATSFNGVEHRIEFVKNLNGVKWYNDSIATSPTRTIAGLKSFKQKVILIAGGYDKHISYKPLVPYILNKVSTLILTGHTSEYIYQAVTTDPNYNQNNINIIKVKDLSEAVNKASIISKAGDIVLLSPASASFDAYINFEARGKHFKSLIYKL